MLKYQTNWGRKEDSFDQVGKSIVSISPNKRTNTLAGALPHSNLLTLFSSGGESEVSETARGGGERRG